MKKSAGEKEGSGGEGVGVRRKAQGGGKGPGRSEKGRKREGGGQLGEQKGEGQGLEVGRGSLEIWGEQGVRGGGGRCWNKEKLLEGRWGPKRMGGGGEKGGERRGKGKGGLEKGDTRGGCEHGVGDNG